MALKSLRISVLTLLCEARSNLLTEFAKKGFSYEELRWRHILRDYYNNLFLVDLESLTDPAKSTSEQWVANVAKVQVDEVLKKSATATPSPADAFVLVKVARVTHQRI
jgi:hypothetical protein